MKISEGIKQAYDRQWSMINTFTVQINAPAEVTSRVGVFTDDINLNIISLTTPDFTNDPIESFIANRWIIHNGKDQLYRWSITFRDQDQMSLYRAFMQIYEMTKTNYFDDVALNIIVSKDADWYNESDKVMMELNGTLIEGVSNLSFSNDTEAQIAEFTVSFKSTEAVMNY